MAYFGPKKALRPKFSTGGGRVFFGVNGHFLWFRWPSYGHKKTMGMVVKKNFDRTQLSPYPITVRIILDILFIVRVHEHFYVQSVIRTPYISYNIVYMVHSE